MAYRVPGRHVGHNAWLSLLEISGPFLSSQVLDEEFHEGLDAPDTELNKLLRAVYEEWVKSQEQRPPDNTTHVQWLRFVLTQVLALPILKLDEADPHAVGLKYGPALPPKLNVYLPQHQTTLQPDYALFSGETPLLLVTTYGREQSLTESTKTGWSASPASRMEALLQATEVPLGLVTNGERWMLVHVLPKETTSFVSWYANLWIEESLTLRAFRSLLARHRFTSVAEEKMLSALLKRSAEHQQEVTIELGNQVRRAVEVLLQSLNRIDAASRARTHLDELSEATLYEAALTVMMRLVFLLYAEERRLLPLDSSQLYSQHYAASTLLAQLREHASRNADTFLEKRFDAWSRLLTLFRIVYGGVEHQDLSLRAYGGDLFDPDRFPLLEGRAPGTHWQEEEAEPLPIDNRTVMHLLEALQLLRGSGRNTEARRLSFRALDVEQIGHVYEGLLDHTAKRASETMLSIKVKEHESVEIALAQLATARAEKGEEGVLDLLAKATGRDRASLRKALAQPLDLFARGKLLSACGNDDTLVQRVLPYANLLRNDSFNFPLVIQSGALYMTQGSDRRSTGTHYTPRTLTVPMVKYTLDPLVYQGPAEGWDESAWQLRSAGEIINLKICDMAMGSGAFLVQSCRYLAERLMEAWEAAERFEGVPQIAPAGTPSRHEHEEILIPLDPEEKRALAQRIIAERCLYGVDKNPLAVEMAKLSLWLITLSKDLPFTFLNHALRQGDSLLGVLDLAQLKRWSEQSRESAQKKASKDDKAETLRFVQVGIEDAIALARRLRNEIRNMPNQSAQDNQKKQRKVDESKEATALIQLGADLYTLLILLGYTQDKYRDLPTDIEYAILVAAYDTASRQHYSENGRNEARAGFASMRSRVDALLGDKDPFHWSLEYPETFMPNGHEPGFDALLSNPPFQGGQRITGALSTDYREYLVNHLAYGKRGSADLCAYFFLRASSLVHSGGQYAMLATNTIAQGDTREVGLDQITAMGWTIPRAVHSMKWPGSAALEVAYLWLRHGDWQGLFYLDEIPVDKISSYLTSVTDIQGVPETLIRNQGMSFIGSYVLGMGFVLEPEEVQALIEKDQLNRNVLFPYLNGEDLNSRPDQSPSRWIINFFDWSLDVAETYYDCMKIIREKVKAEREQKTFSKNAREKWWLYERRRPELYDTITKRNLKRILVIPRVSKYMICAWEPTNIICSEATCVIASESDIDFVIIQSTIHEDWARLRGSTLESRMRYTPTDCFETFPFPKNLQGLDRIGRLYDQHRRSITLSRQEGLTQTYNHFHNQRETAADIVRLRELHCEMDEAVKHAYGWDELELGHGFHETRQGVRYTISEEARREVLGRLLRLNHERYAEEVAQGLHEKGAKASKKGKVTRLEDARGLKQRRQDGPGRQVKKVAETPSAYGVVGQEPLLPE